MLRFNLEEHLRREHKITAFSTYLREIVYGGNDGIVTTFAVVAGFHGAQANPHTTSVPIISVLLFGLANLFADGLSMSLGSFLSLRADQDVFAGEKAKELSEIRHDQQNELAETVDILQRKGFSVNDAQAIARLYSKNEKYWTAFMMHDELEMADPEKEKPLFIALSTFLSFISFGSIPLLPYLLNFSTSTLFITSVGFTFLSLILLGVIRASVTKRGVVRAITETMLTGGTAALVAYLVGSFFRG